MMKSPERRVPDMLLDEIDGYSRIVLRGECNRGLAARLTQRLDQLIREGCRGLVLDTREVRYLDNSCYQALTGAVEQVRARGGECVIVDQSDPLERSLKLLSLGEMVRSVATMSQASTYLRWTQ
jgi:anti-anti-sigma factor